MTKGGANYFPIFLFQFFFSDANLSHVPHNVQAVFLTLKFRLYIQKLFYYIVLYVVSSNIKCKNNVWLIL
jgi:hypothetical protein